VIGVGRLAEAVAEVIRSRIDADRALRVLAVGRRSGRVARFDEVQCQSLLLRMGDLVNEDGGLVLGGVGTLLDYDAKHKGALVETLVCYLDSFGDITAAAARVHVHPNTFRYRLGRLVKLSGLNLADPELRLETLLILRLYGLGAAAEQEHAD